MRPCVLSVLFFPFQWIKSISSINAVRKMLSPNVWWWHMAAFWESMVHIVIISIDYESPCELVVSTDVFKRLVGLEYVYSGCRWISIGVVNRIRINIGRWESKDLLLDYSLLFAALKCSSRFSVLQDSIPFTFPTTTAPNTMQTNGALKTLIAIL